MNGVKNNLPKPVEELYSFLRKNWFTYYTGSNAIFDDGKDYDFVIGNRYNKSVLDKIKRKFGGKELSGTSYSLVGIGRRSILRVYLVKEKGIIFNSYYQCDIIIENYEDISNWILATEFCKNKPNLAINKRDRLRIFEDFGVPQDIISSLRMSSYV